LKLVFIYFEADQIMYIDTKTEVAAEEVDTTGQYISAIRIPNRFRTNVSRLFSCFVFS